MQRVMPPYAATRHVVPASAAFLLLFAGLSAPLLWQPTTFTFALLPASLVLATVLAVLSAVDLRMYRLPDVLTLPLTGIGLAVSAWSGAMPLWWSAVSAVGAFALLAGVAYGYRYVRGRSGLGLGDAKLMAASGAWLGLEALPTVLFCAAGSALLCAGAARWRGEAMTATTRMPFGPFLAFATWLVWLYGPL